MQSFSYSFVGPSGRPQNFSLLCLYCKHFHPLSQPRNSTSLLLNPKVRSHWFLLNPRFLGLERSSAQFMDSVYILLEAQLDSRFAVIGSTEPSALTSDSYQLPSEYLHL